MFVLRVFNVGELLREGKPTQWLSMCLNALSETFYNSAVLYQWLTSGLLLCLNALFFS